MTIVQDRPSAGDEADRANLARKAMIDSQLRTSGVNAEPVLRRMAEVAREDFPQRRAASPTSTARSHLATGATWPPPWCTV